MSRAAQFLGGGYMLAAAYAARRDAKAPFAILGPSHGNPPHRYGIAIALVLAAAVLRLVFMQELGTRAAFIVFYPAVMLAAFYGGLRNARNTSLGSTRALLLDEAGRIHAVIQGTG